MQEEIKITLPKLGESIVSATVVQWFKKEGDFVHLDEPLLEVSTDKINSEIPSPVAGVLQKIVVQESQELQVGEVLAIMAAAAKAPGAIAAQVPAASVCSSSEDRGDFLSPSVMRLMKERGVSLEEISRIGRTGEGGRLTKKDLEAYLEQRAGSSAAPSRTDTERVKMSALRKAIADNMVRSFYEAPHASLMTEVDVTALVRLMQQQKTPFFEEHGAKLTMSSFAARAMARAVSAFPLINASLEGDTILVKRFVNLGVAVSIEQGVMVPVIKNCQQLSLAEIAAQIAHLAEKARTGKLSPLDVQEGTITMTNFGMTGVMIGVPIIRYPEVAIVGLGAITRKVVAMADDSVAIRSMMWVSLTFDHRVLDGIYGCGFLGELKKQLESDLSL
jgi:2-oxoglutarate dehydrogenase E2 component (dihydrolipoamide succinyltransferase)